MTGIKGYKEIGLSTLKATEKLGISYNTTNKWWDKTDEDFSSFQKEHEFVLDNYRQYIIEQLKLCPQINNTLILRGCTRSILISISRRQNFSGINDYISILNVALSTITTSLKITIDIVRFYDIIICRNYYVFNNVRRGLYEM